MKLFLAVFQDLVICFALLMTLKAVAQGVYPDFITVSCAFVVTIAAWAFFRVKIRKISREEAEEFERTRQSTNKM